MVFDFLRKTRRTSLLNIKIPSYLDVNVHF